MLSKTCSKVVHVPDIGRTTPPLGRVWMCSPFPGHDFSSIAILMILHLKRNRVQLINCGIAAALVEDLAGGGEERVQAGGREKQPAATRVDVFPPRGRILRIMHDRVCAANSTCNFI